MVMFRRGRRFKRLPIFREARSHLFKGSGIQIVNIPSMTNGFATYQAMFVSTRFTEYIVLSRRETVLFLLVSVIYDKQNAISIAIGMYKDVPLSRILSSLKELLYMLIDTLKRIRQSLSLRFDIAK